MKIPHSQLVSSYQGKTALVLPSLLAIAFCFAMGFSACGNDSDQARETATAEALESIQAPTGDQPAQPNPADPSQQQQNQDNNQPTPSAQPKDNRPKSAGTMDMTVGGGSTSKGSEVCVAVSAKNFKAIVSVQYSVKWDAKVLKFKGLKGFGLPGLGPDNFGKHIVDKGQLTHSWFDATVKGVSKGDGETLYEICFEAIGAAGSKSAVQIVDAPTIIEIANANSEFYTLNPTPGTVLVK